MEDTELNKRLQNYFSKKVQLHSDPTSRALEIWQPKVDKILEFIKDRDPLFKFKRLPSGSYYERTKVKKPDEYDIMLVVGPTFYSIDGTTSHNVAPYGFKTVTMGERDLNATRVKNTFASYVAEAIESLQYSNTISLTQAGPAATLKIQDRKKRMSYSVDLTLALKLSSWPDEAQEWITRARGSWPSVALIEEIVEDGCHLVAKRPKPLLAGDASQYFWRLSFSSAEKKLALKGEGQPGTCNKKVLRILKSLREENDMTPLTSYHLKTIMFYEREKFPNPSQWTENKVACRFKSALSRLKNCLDSKVCPHYFMKDLNLFDEGFQNHYGNLIYQVNDIQDRPENFLI